MAASLGPSWSLRSNASPRCLTAYVTKANDGSSSIGGGGGGGGGGGESSSNPFDDESISSRSHQQQHQLGGATAAAAGLSGYDNDVYSVAFGTERGSLHYRQYPPLKSEDGHGRDDHRRGSYHHHHQHERNRDPSQLFIDPESTPEGQINLQGAVKGSIVGIVRARPNDSITTATTTTPVFLLLVDDNRGTSSSASSNPGAYAAHLVTVKHGAFNKLPAAPAVGVDGSSNNSANTPDKPPLSSSHASHHRRVGSHASAGGSVVGGSWFGGESPASNIAGHKQLGGASQSGVAPNAPSAASSSAVTKIQSLGALPRMSCVTYHPSTGFVYAAGTGVYGLPLMASKAVLAGMTYNSEGSATFGGVSGRPFHHSTNASISSSSRSMRGQQHGHATTTTTNANFAGSAQMTIPPPMAVYLKCNHSLPLPGVRCSSGGGGSNGNSMTLACDGRVAIVAVSNAFYAVPACLDANALKHRIGGGDGPSAKPSGGAAYAIGSSSSLSSVTATKVLTFAQSSQVHPVIAMEVVPSSSPSTSSDISRHLKPITSLLFLASGRECTTLEMASVPDPRAVSVVVKGSTIAGGGMVTTSVKCSSPKHGMATLPSPILAAAPLPPTAKAGKGGNGGDLTAGPLVALLTVDGLVHIRSPFCVAVPLASIEVGTRPNDFFTLSSLPTSQPFRYGTSSADGGVGRNIVATSYGGEARLVSTHVETLQDFADRLIKLCIDAFGSNGFPRLELAEALGATFSATSYVGPEPTAHKRILLKQYLESALGLDDHGSSGGGMRGPSSPEAKGGGLEDDGRNEGEEFGTTPSSSSLGANSLLTCTALLCLVCYQLNPPNGATACRASKACASGMGIVRPKESGISKAAMAVCELVADRLLKEVSTSFSLLSGTSSSGAPIASSHMNRMSMSNRHPSSQAGSASMEFVESAVWLLRSCGCHEKAIDVLQERMNSPAFRNASVGTTGGQTSSGGSGVGSWSQIKFDSYLATHLGELWSSKDDRCCQLVLLSPATKDLIARNPTLGLSVFTTIHPQNETEWKKMNPADDPLAHPIYPPKVVEMLKTIVPHQHPQGMNELGMAESFSSFSPGPRKIDGPLPIDSGRALAVSYLESAIGIATGRPAPTTSQTSSSGSASSFRHQESSPRDEMDERKADMHDELSYLLLEGVISERGDNDDPSGVGDDDSGLGAVYRFKLRRLLSWPNSKIRSERLLSSLPKTFLREHALLLGRLGRHEDALQILYSQENSLELALEYCDARHERQMAKRAQMEEKRASGGAIASALPPNECAYIPLVKVALSSDPDSDRGTAAAIRVLALRRDSIDKASALRLLPRNIPMSSVVRPFLIPAVVENESQVRRLTVASSLLRSKYNQLKQKLTEAQLTSQATLESALALKGLNLGDPIHSSMPTKARPVHAASPYYPDVTLVKHFFPRYLVIQAQVMNSNNSTAMTATFQPNNTTRTLADVAFVIAESSDEALVPTVELPLKTVPPGATGSVWCVLAASPQRLDGAAFLTCELRFTVLEVDAATGTPLNFSDESNAATNTGFGRTYVEELQDMEVRHTEFG